MKDNSLNNIKSKNETQSFVIVYIIPKYKNITINRNNLIVMRETRWWIKTLKTIWLIKIKNKRNYLLYRWKKSELAKNYEKWGLINLISLDKIDKTVYEYFLQMLLFWENIQ